MKFRDLPSAQFGRYGETIAARLLRNLGAGVIATFKFSGENDNEAPAIELSNKRIVLADLDVSMRGRTLSIEIKTYKEPQWNRAHRCLVHGIPLRLVDEYINAERERGIPIHIGVLEVDSGSLLVSDDPISKIAPKYACLCGCDNDVAKCDYRRKWGNSHPQWYLRRDTFREWHKLVGDDLKKLQAEHERVAHVMKRHGSGLDLPPKPLFIAPPWTHACLPCNWTGTDPSKHVCKTLDYALAYWTRRLTWAFHGDAVRAKEALVAPIERSELAGWLGSSWLPTGDIA